MWEYYQTNVTGHNNYTEGHATIRNNMTFSAAPTPSTYLYLYRATRRVAFQQMNLHHAVVTIQLSSIHPVFKTICRPVG